MKYTVVKWTKLYETEPWKEKDIRKVNIPLGNPSLDKQYEDAKQIVERVRTKQRRLREKFSLNKEDIEELKKHDEELKKMSITLFIYMILFFIIFILNSVKEIIYSLIFTT